MAAVSAMATTWRGDAQRRIDVAQSATLNGIDFIEVVDVGAQFQQGLRVHFLRSPAPAGITAAHVLVRGGERFTGLVVDRPPAYDGDVLVLHVDRAGDFSHYTLQLVQPDGSGLPMDGIDPVLSVAGFSFKVGCPSAFDCKPVSGCAPALLRAPDIDYLAKDYSGFRQLMLDRLAVLLPDWQERHAADLGQALVEMLAHVGDLLSYRQDAVATEAYLGTARLRTSVRRHARLVDYVMHEGVSARVWVSVQVSDDNVQLPAATPLLGGLAAAPSVLARAGYAAALQARPTVFETLHEATLFQAHGRINLHTWGERRSALPAGATQATLRGRFDQLKPGDVLIFEERLGPLTGRPEDADPRHRQAVRLSSVVTDDARGGPLVDPLYAQAITQVTWAAEDALGFALCLATRLTSGAVETDLMDVSVARGNVVLADHGLRTSQAEPLGQVPQPRLWRGLAADGSALDTPAAVAPRYRPALAQSPLCWAVPVDAADRGLSAAALARPDPAAAVPAVALTSQLGATPVDWHAQRDLLDSRGNNHHFVVEPDDDGIAWLRFGDGVHGRRPPPDMAFAARYRVGGGRSGNVGAGTLACIVSDDRAITGIHQPLPASGGADPESVAVVRAKAPFALRTQQRAVTAADYARIASGLPGVQSAAATLRWTGSWHTVFVTVELYGGAPLSPTDRARVAGALDVYRMAGHDLKVEPPVSVPLEVTMQVNADADHFRGDVVQALFQVFSHRVLPDGRLGFFHPDNFRIGQDVYASPLYAAAMAVDGVASVQLTRFQRRDAPGRVALDRGVVVVDRLELARLDNNPDFPERGVFDLVVSGGK